jgi:hypothetical protein
MIRARSVIGYVLASIGVTVVLATMAYQFWVDYTASVGGVRPVHEFVWIPLCTGAVLGWWGFYWVDGTRAVKGGDFLLTAKDRLQRVRLVPLAGTAADRRAPNHPPEQTESVHNDDEPGV